MKKVTVVLALAAFLLALPIASVRAHDLNCEEHGDHHGHHTGCGDPVRPVSVPEPNSFILLASGLVALGGLAIFGRKRLLRVNNS